MSTELLKDKITIVIPSKNEGSILYDCIQHISTQEGIAGTKVIVADVSDDDISIKEIKRLKTDFSHSLKIDIIRGGYPAAGRLYGSLLVRTPYMLFLDADVMLTKPNILINSILDKDLVTVPFFTDKPYGFVFRAFDIFQSISVLLGTPFAIGGFQLWKTDAYWEVGGYNQDELFAEDYSISKKVNKNKFKVVNLKGVYTSARRFRSKGILWMFMIMIKSFIHRNNPSFFKKTHGYWN